MLVIPPDRSLLRPFLHSLKGQLADMREREAALRETGEALRAQIAVLDARPVTFCLDMPEVSPVKDERLSATRLVIEAAAPAANDPYAASWHEAITSGAPVIATTFGAVHWLERQLSAETCVPAHLETWQAAVAGWRPAVAKYCRRLMDQVNDADPTIPRPPQ